MYQKMLYALTPAHFFVTSAYFFWASLAEQPSHVAPVLDGSSLDICWPTNWPSLPETWAKGPFPHSCSPLIMSGFVCYSANRDLQVGTLSGGVCWLTWTPSDAAPAKPQGLCSWGHTGTPPWLCLMSGRKGKSPSSSFLHISK